MRHALPVVTAILAFLFSLPAPAAGDGDTPAPAEKKEQDKEPKDSKPDATENGPAAAESGQAPKSSTEPESLNLSLPADLSIDARKALEEAIAAYQAAEKAMSGRDKLLTRAIAKLKSASAKAPKCALPSYYLGMAYQIKRNFPQAKTVLEKAVKLNPRFNEAFAELGDVYVWQKKLKESLPVYDQALAIAPSSADARERKAIALIRMGNVQAAKSEVEQALKAQATLSRKRLLLLIDHELKGPPWEHAYTVESENYNVTTSISEKYAHEIANHAELIRRAYNTIFSGIPKPDRKYEVWVYDSLDAYHKAGGPPPAAGHYDPLFRKLVIPRQAKPSDTFMVLHHEAFHQYLHDYVDLAPQWFNEGLGDYFGAYEYDRSGEKELMLSRTNPWRLRGAQISIQEKILAPAGDLMLMSREEFYNPATIAHNYVEAWGIMYFIIEGNKPEYKRVLISYFNAIRKGRDLNEAYQQTFGKLDMTKFDSEWKGYIANLGSK